MFVDNQLHRGGGLLTHVIRHQWLYCFHKRFMPYQGIEFTYGKFAVSKALKMEILSVCFDREFMSTQNILPIKIGLSNRCFFLIILLFSFLFLDFIFK